LLGYYSESDFDPDMWDKAESLPGCYIIQREVKKAIAGEDFFFNDSETGKPKRVEGITHNILNEYVQLWDDFHYLKVLPHGKGTLSERRWVLDAIKALEKTFIETEFFIEEQAHKKAKV